MGVIIRLRFRLGLALIAGVAVTVDLAAAGVTALTPARTGAAASPAAARSWTAYVANGSSDTVTPVDTATNTAGAEIPVGSSPTGVAITPDGRTAYVTNVYWDTVTPIDTVTNTAGTEMPVGFGPDGIAITPDQAPVARLSVTAASAGLPTRFDASASTVAFGTIVAYVWNFSDGTTATTTSADDHAHLHVGGELHRVGDGGQFGGNLDHSGVHRPDDVPQRRPSGDGLGDVRREPTPAPTDNDAIDYYPSHHGSAGARPLPGTDPDAGHLASRDLTEPDHPSDVAGHWLRTTTPRPRRLT